MTPAQAEFLANLLYDLRSPDNEPVPKKWVRLAMVIFDQEMVKARKAIRAVEQYADHTKECLSYSGKCVCGLDNVLRELGLLETNGTTH